MEVKVSVRKKDDDADPIVFSFRKLSELDSSCWLKLPVNSMFEFDSKPHVCTGSFISYFSNGESSLNIDLISLTKEEADSILSNSIKRMKEARTKEALSKSGLLIPGA